MKKRESLSDVTMTGAAHSDGEIPSADERDGVLIPRRCTLSGFTEETATRRGVHVGGLAAVTRLSIRTRNTRYVLTVVEPAQWKVLIQGGRYFPTERLAFLCGSGYGGTLLKVAWIGVGLCCEFSSKGQRVVTSPVQDFEVLEHALPGPF